MVIKCFNMSKKSPLSCKCVHVWIHNTFISPEREAGKEKEDKGQQHQRSTAVQLNLRWQRLKRFHCGSLKTSTHAYIWIYRQWHMRMDLCRGVLTTYKERTSVPLSPSMSSSISLERVPSTRTVSSSRGTVKPSSPHTQPLKRARRFSILHRLELERKTKLKKISTL